MIGSMHSYILIGREMQLINIYVPSTWLSKIYCIAGKFGRGKVWRIDSFRAFGERKFGELIDQPIGY